MARNRPLWKCTKCGRVFANRNQSHSCGRFKLADHFTNKPPEIRRLFNVARKAIESCGPLRVLPEKTRIGFQVRMTFAQLTPRTRWIDGHVVLARRLESPRFRKIESFSPRNHAHHFRLETVADVDSEFGRWMKEGYAVGEQKHLGCRSDDK